MTAIKIVGRHQPLIFLLLKSAPQKNISAFNQSKGRLLARLLSIPIKIKQLEKWEEFLSRITI